DEKGKADSVGRYPIQPDANDREFGNRGDEGQKGREDSGRDDGENPSGQRAGESLDRRRKERRHEWRDRDQRNNHIKPWSQTTPRTLSASPFQVPNGGTGENQFANSNAPFGKLNRNRRGNTTLTLKVVITT